MDDTPRGRGRPPIGGAVRVRLGDLADAVDAYAVQHGLLFGGEPNRSEAVRQLVQRGLEASNPTP